MLQRIPLRTISPDGPNQPLPVPEPGEPPQRDPQPEPPQRDPERDPPRIDPPAEPPEPGDPLPEIRDPPLPHVDRATRSRCLDVL